MLVRRKLAVAEVPTGHTPVLPEQVADLLAVREGETVVDVTVGLAGHARRFVASIVGEASGPPGGMLVGLDVDAACLSVARLRLAETTRAVDASASCRVELVRANFAELRSVLTDLGIDKVDVIFADLGVSSTQLADAERGFSFQRDGPLDMRMDSRLKETAADLVNRLKERDLGDLLYFNAQEHASRRIARRICEARRARRITTTGQLVEAVAGALGVDPKSRRSKIHPATRTFQALRMAVNGETQSLDTLLGQAPDLLRPGGRIGIIAFHSVEDKPVKVDFRARHKDGVYQLVTKRPVVADEVERRANPRSRSAKFRVAVRLP